jgi:P2-related tail formation protein
MRGWKMIKLQDALITDGLPDIISNEPWAKAIAYAVNVQIKKIINFADASMVYGNVHKLSDLALNAFAAEIRTPQYDETYDRKLREELVENTMELLIRAGTKQSVLNLTRKIFNSAEISEWWESDYKGKCGEGYFGIITDNVHISDENINEFLRVVSSMKRMSVWLEKIVSILKPLSHNVSAGFYTHEAAEHTYIMSMQPDFDVIYKSTIVGFAIHEATSCTIKMRGD